MRLAEFSVQSALRGIVVILFTTKKDNLEVTGRPTTSACT